ncbi:MAG: hypothetical protein WDN06_17725 [Asticcacaulis sp.]
MALSGSGNFTSSQSADTDLQNQGSGDVTLAHVANLRVQLNGSGDLDSSSVNGNLVLVNNGSSDVSIGRVNGPINLSLSGSGDVGIDGGQAPSFMLTGSGSGDVHFRRHHQYRQHRFQRLGRYLDPEGHRRRHQQGQWFGRDAYRALILARKRAVSLQRRRRPILQKREGALAERFRVRRR